MTTLTVQQAKLIESADRLMFFCQSRCVRSVGVASKAADRVAALARKNDSGAGFWLASALTELRHVFIRESAMNAARAAARWEDEETHDRERRRHCDEMSRHFESFKRAVARS
jgi:hypothetical protein